MRLSTFVVLGILLFNSFILFSQDKIVLNNRIYLKVDGKFYLKEDSIWVETISYKDKKFEKGFSYNSLARRNDSIFMQAVMKIDYAKKVVRCKEFFYFDQKKLKDSSHRDFKQIANGAFKLIKYSEFKNGKEIILYPFKTKDIAH